MKIFDRVTGSLVPKREYGYTNTNIRNTYYTAFVDLDKINSDDLIDDILQLGVSKIVYTKLESARPWANKLILECSYGKDTIRVININGKLIKKLISVGVKIPNSFIVDCFNIADDFDDGDRLFIKLNNSGEYDV